MHFLGEEPHHYPIHDHKPLDFRVSGLPLHIYDRHFTKTQDFSNLKGD